MFGNSPFVSSFQCRFHHTLTSHGYLALSQGFSCEGNRHVSCDWRGTGRMWVSGLSRACLQLSGRPVQETRTPREKVFISSQPFVFDSDRFQSFRLGSKWAWDGSKSPVYSQRPKRLCWRTWQVVPRFLHEWMMCPLLHARIPVSRTADWSHDVIRQMSVWANKIDQQLLKIVW